MVPVSRVTSAVPLKPTGDLRFVDHVRQLYFLKVIFMFSPHFYIQTKYLIFRLICPLLPLSVSSVRLWERTGSSGHVRLLSELSQAQSAPARQQRVSY